jgi:hypothetical protein
MSEPDSTASKQDTRDHQLPRDSDADTNRLQSSTDAYNEWIDRQSPKDLADIFRSHLESYDGNVPGANATAMRALYNQYRASITADSHVPQGR